MHIGHTIPFEFTKWLQDVFDVPLVIMMTDDEKFLFKEKLTQLQVYQFARDNAKDIISIGFDVRKTFRYIDSEFFTSGYNRHFSLNAAGFEKLITNNQVRGAFGFHGSKNIGSNAFVAKQCVTALLRHIPSSGAITLRHTTAPQSSPQCPALFHAPSTRIPISALFARIAVAWHNLRLNQLSSIPSFSRHYIVQAAR
jgi:tryptophanyl-tRNA synthetase